MNAAFFYNKRTSQRAHHTRDARSAIRQAAFLVFGCGAGGSSMLG